MSTISCVVKIGLHIYGVWPYLWSTKLFRLYWVVMLSTAQAFQYRYVVINIRTDDFTEFMDGLSSTLASTLLYIKFIILWVNQRKIFNILQWMSADWQTHTSRYTQRVMNKAANRAHRLSHLIIGLQVIAVFLYSVGLFAKANTPEKAEPTPDDFILKMNLPFQISTNAAYMVVLAIQFYHLMLVACGITTINSLLVTLILHIGGQIDIIRGHFVKVFSKNGVRPTDGITIRSLITKHQQIILFSEHIEQLYTYIALMMLLSDTLIICCLGFIIVTSIDAPNSADILIKSVLFYLTMNLEAFIYCMCGEYLSAKSKLIGDAAYNSLWYHLTHKESRIIHFVIIRSQRQLAITSGKIVELSLECFTSVVKASVSYISVLLVMYRR